MPDLEAANRNGSSQNGYAPHEGVASTLQGKVAIITGAGDGIGKAAAVALSRSGASVVIVDKNLSAGRQCCDEVKASSGKALTVSCDAASDAGSRYMVHAAIQEFGRVDLLVCSAGLMLIRGAKTASLEDWAASFAANVTAAALCVRYAAVHMKRNGGGAVVLVGSISGHRPDPGFATYSASKAALLMLTRSLALEYGPDGIRVNAVSPGPVETRGLRSLVESHGSEWNQWKERVTRLQCLQTMIQPEDVAMSILFLCTDAARMITGTSLVVDGGLLSRAAL